MVPGARLVILGKQGAGKGTQCVRLARHYVVPHIATGDIFRGAARIGTDWGRKVKAYMDAGELVPDDVTIGVIRERLDEDDIQARGFILDGFPRNVFQAEALADILAPEDIHLAIDLEVPTDVAVKRLASRRVCRSCGTNYSLEVPPGQGWICNLCGGSVVQRADDTETAIKRRLELYQDETEPLIEFYLKRDKLVTIDALGTPDDVTNRLVRAIDRRRPE